MKRLIMSGLALALVAGTALAQQPPAPETPPPAAAGQAAPPPPPPAGVPPMGDARGPVPHDHAGPPHGPGPGMDRRPDGPDGGPRAREDDDFRGNRPPPPPPSRAAHFRIMNGETSIDLKCAEDEPAKACADLLLQVMDRMQAPNRQ